MRLTPAPYPGRSSPGRCFRASRWPRRRTARDCVKLPRGAWSVCYRTRAVAMRHRCVTLTLLALLTAPAARAAEPPILDVAAVPYLKPQGRASYADFLLINVPRAMALASN